uniref:Uncharacterized protein n=1 Tax=Tanacetum cinerariifolium TaxID=118510 RepID=A0A699ITM6_TANCI|nr:hypothetical protein [Tanacetum cinerariifolium]
MATTIEQQLALDEALVPSTQREMLHICHRIPGQAFDELPFEEEILEFIRFFGHGATIRTLTDININKLYQPWRSFAAIINKCLTGKSSGYNSFWLSQAQILNTKAYKEYYVFATGEAAPKPKASARRKRSGLDTSITPPTATTTPTTTVVVTLKLTVAVKGKQLAKAKSPSDPLEVARTEAQQLKIVLRRSRQQTYISQPGGSGTDDQEKVGDDDEGDEEVAKNDDKDDIEESGNVDKEGKSDEEDDDEETRDEENFDPIPQTPERSEDECDGEEDQGLRISEEERLNEEEEVEKLYRDVNINQGRGIQATLDVKDSHVTLTPVHPDGQQESSSVSSHFVTSMLNPPSDAGMESIFATASSSVAPLQTYTPIMTPSTISTITTIIHAPIPLTTIQAKFLKIYLLLTMSFAL